MSGGRLPEVVTGARPAGVYRWRSRAHPAAVGRDLAQCGWGWYVLNGRAVTGAVPLLDRCAELLAFPAWFRPDFDTLRHCLEDLSWLPGHGHVVLWEAWWVLARRDPRTWRRAYQVFAAAAAGRPAGAPPLYLLLRADRVPEPAIPLL